jgi:hypothetical protein
MALHFGKEDKKLNSTVKFFSYGSFDLVKLALGIVLILALYFIYRKNRLRIKKAK